MFLSQPALRRLRFRQRFVLLALLFPLACTLHAQIAGTGTIQGAVTDSTGAVISNAAVTLIEESTQVKRSAHSDASGLYTFPNIDVGTYTVSVTAAGFSTYNKTHNVLEVGSNIAVNVPMTVGRTEQTVEVRAEGIALQTEDAKFKQTVDAKEITELPLNSASRQITGLLAIAGGTAPAPSGDFTGSKYSYQTISISVAGGMGNTTLWRLDGGDNNDYMGNGNLPFPFPDALNQFSVESSVLGAQDGMHSGGLVNAVTRSGTNQYHGAAFDFIRNNIINASNFFSATKDSLHQNQFGGTFGGPVRRDKLFAFAGYQRLQATSSSASTTAHVPTAANLAGDFSQTDPAPGTAITSSSCRTSTIQLVDPLTGATIPGNVYAAPPAWNAQALALQKLLPTSIDTCGTVKYAIPTKTSDNEFVTRVDWNINAANNFYGRYFIDGYQQPAIFQPTNILVTTQSGNIERTQSLTLGENLTVNSHTVNSAHLTLLRRSNNRGYAANDINAASLGVNAYQLEPNGLYLVATNKFTLGGGTNSVAHFNDNTLTLNDDLTYVHGPHQFVFGGEFARNQLNILNTYEANGNFTFGGTYSGSGPNGGTTVGDADLDFLRGAMSAYQQSKTQQNALRGNIPSLYAQDTWHANKKLTLIAGVRWSPEFIPTDFFNRGSVFNMSAFMANQVSSVYPNAPAGSFFYGDPGVSRNFTKNSPWQFSPNVGFSVDPAGNGKTVIRGGYELIYDEVNYYTGQRVQQNPPFATAISETQTSTSGPLSFSSPFSVGSITTNPFPQPQIPTGTSAQFFSQSQYIVLPTQFHPSYTSQYTLSLQHQFPHDWQAQLDYIGNKTTHTPLSFPLSPAVFVPGVWGAGGTGCAGVVQMGPAAAAPLPAGAPCSTIANQNARFALTELNPTQGNQYAGGGGGSIQISSEGTANYNGLIATLQHRLSSTFSLLTNYTLSKCLNEEDAQGDYANSILQNNANAAQDYGPCGSDYRNIYNLVIIARSQVHLKNAVARSFVNGWEIAPLIHMTSGAPFTVTSGVDNSFTDQGYDRPNIVPGVPVYLHQQISNKPGAGTEGYLNAVAFASVTAGCPTITLAGKSYINVPQCPGYGTFGNISRNSFRGPVYIQTDATLTRIFPIHESFNMQLRLEAFNFLNHPYFSNPAASTASGTFGQITSTAGEGPRIFQGSVKFSF